MKSIYKYLTILFAGTISGMIGMWYLIKPKIGNDFDIKGKIKNSTLTDNIINTQLNKKELRKKKRKDRKLKK